MRKALLPLTLLLTVACSSSVLTPNRERLEEEIAELKSRVLELQRKAAVSEIEMARLRQQVASLSMQAAGPNREPQAAEPALRAATVVEPSPVPINRSAPGPIEEAELEEVDDTPAPPSVPARDPRPVAAAEQRLYDEGYTLYHRQQYVDAEAAFQTFLDSYPRSDLADNAQYWIGECRYARQDYRGALAAFRETVNRHPEGNKVPDALLKVGQTLEVIGDLKGARESYQEVERRFPDSAAALVAAERLEDLSS